MPKKIGVAISILVIVLLGAQLIYAQLKLSHQSSSGVALNAMMRELHTQVGELNVAVKERDTRLNELSDAQAIRATLSSAQGAIDKLNSDLQQALSDKAALQAANVNLGNRLTNTTQELTQAIDQLKQSRGQIATLEKTGAGTAKTATAAASPADAASQQQMKQEVARIKQERQLLADDNAFLERKMRDIEAEKGRLAMKLSELQRQLSTQGTPLVDLQETVKRLTVTLNDKESQLRALESEAAGRRSAQARGGEITGLYESAKEQLRDYAESLRVKERELEGARQELEDTQRKLQEAQGVATLQQQSVSGKQAELQRVKELEEESLALKKQITDLTSQLEAAERRIASMGTAGGSAQLVADKAALQDTVTQLQEKIAVLQRRLDAGGEGGPGLKALEDQRTILEYRLKEAEAALAKKTELAESLQQSLDTLKERLARKDEEQQAIEDKISELESMSASLKEQLVNNRALAEDRDAQYTALKNQITQLSEVLTRKELELNERRMEIAAIKNEVAGLKVRSARLEEDLSAARQRQRQTLDDLSQAIKLNASLQERIVEISQSQGAYKGDTDLFGEGDAEKARALKKRIEVILQPQ